MSHEKNKKRVTHKQSPPINKGQHDLLAKCLAVPSATIRKQYTRNKYDAYIVNGQYDFDGIKNNMAKIFQPKCKHARKSQIAKSDKPNKKSKTKINQDEQAETEKPETKKEIEKYLNETIGELHELPIDELWRRNELEKLLMAQIKRRNVEGQLIEAESVKRAAFSAGLMIREGLESIVERCAPLVAATSDVFDCREMLFKEINHILNGMADALQVSQ